MVSSTDADDANMLLDIAFSMNQVIIDQYLTLNLSDICLDNTLQILSKWLIYALQKLITQKSTKFGCKILNGQFQHFISPSVFNDL